MKMATNNIPDLNDGTGNATLVSVLQSWGISLFSGVNGGGVIHFAKYLKPLRRLDEASNTTPQLFTINEDIASFIPIGHYWASGKIAASLFTTGGAAYYGATGLIGAKSHNVPMVAVAALSASDAEGKSPLQYTGPGGAGTIGSYQSILGDGCLVIDDIGGLEEKLIQGREILPRIAGLEAPVARGMLEGRPWRVSLPRTAKATASLASPGMPNSSVVRN